MAAFASEIALERNSFSTLDTPCKLMGLVLYSGNDKEFPESQPIIRGTFEQQAYGWLGRFSCII
jgi:hypothetical protein